MPPNTLPRKLYMLLAANLLTLILAYYNFAKFNSPRMQIEKTLFVCVGIAIAVVGIVTVAVGLWATIQIARSNWKQPASLGTYLILAGLATTLVAFFYGFWLMFIEFCRNGCF